MKLLVLDGNSILNRAFYGIKLLTTKAGDFTNGIYGFLTMLKKLLDETAPGGVAIAFDRKAPTFRHKAYAGYKANRKGMPEELAQQLPVLQELLTDLGYRIVSCEGWEADDILGTLAGRGVGLFQQPQPRQGGHLVAQRRAGHRHIKIVGKDAAAHWLALYAVEGHDGPQHPLLALIHCHVVQPPCLSHFLALALSEC